MTTASEIRKILHKAMDARIDSGKQKAFEALEKIDQLVNYAAKECMTSTEIYILRIVTLDTLEEKQSYIMTIKEELNNNGYHIAFSPGTGILKVTWGY